jgi:hypothetical protein
MTIANSAWFYHGHSRRMIVAFGQLFTKMKLARFNPDGTLRDLVIDIPCENSVADKWYERKSTQEVDDGALKTKGHQLYPRMTYQLVGMEYAADRQQAAETRFVSATGDGSARVTMAPAPWDFNFELVISARNFTDGMQIVEQILPYFRPSHTIVMQDYPFAGQGIDVPIFLEGFQWSDSANDDMEAGSRQVIFSMTFVAQYWLYGPTGSAMEVTVNGAIDTATGTETPTPILRKMIKKSIVNVYTEIENFYQHGLENLVIEVDAPPDT